MKAKPTNISELLRLASALECMHHMNVNNKLAISQI